MNNSIYLNQDVLTEGILVYMVQTDSLALEYWICYNYTEGILIRYTEVYQALTLPIGTKFVLQTFMCFALCEQFIKLY